MNRGRNGRPTGEARANRAPFLIEREAAHSQLHTLPLMLLAVMASAPALAMQTDPAVGDIAADQVSASTLFAAAQLDHVNLRMHALRSTHAPCDRIDVGANIRWERAPSGEEARSAPVSDLRLAEAFKRRCDTPFALWAAGNVDLGFLRPSNANDRGDFRTPGLTIGADRKLFTGAAVGAAVGYGRNDSDIDADGSEARTRGQSLMLFGAFQPIKSLDIDALVGYGDLSFDARRWQAADLEWLSGDRGGSQFFGSFSVSAELAAPNLRLAPYARYDHVRTRFDGYDERGSTTAVIAYGEMRVIENTLALGLDAGFTLPLGTTLIEPRLRVEQRRASGGSFDQGIAYADRQFADSLRKSADPTGRLDASFSVPVRLGAGSIAFEFNYATGSDAFRIEGARALLQAPF